MTLKQSLPTGLAGGVNPIIQKAVGGRGSESEEDEVKEGRRER